MKGFDIYKYLKGEEKTSLLYKNIVDAVNNSAENAEKIQSMNDSFSSTLKKLIAVKRSLKKEPQSLSELSGISGHTLSRMRVKDGMEVSLQMILGVCCGLGLSLPETEMLLDKSPFRLQPTIPEHYAYKSVIPLFKSFTVVEINKILEDAGVRRIGAAKDLDAR